MTLSHCFARMVLVSQKNISEERTKVKIAQRLVGWEVALVWGREIPSRDAMPPFWNPLRGESLSPFTGAVTLMRLAEEKDEDRRL